MSGTAEVIDIPSLKIELEPGGGPDAGIMLEQEWSGNVERVSLHPTQVRLIAERLGILPVTTDVEAQATIARLSSQLRALRHRVKTLDEWLFQAQQKGHEDLTLETSFSEATLDILDAFLGLLPDGCGIEGPPLNNPPKSGAVAATNPPESGAVRTANPPNSGGVGKTGQLALEAAQ